MPWSIWLAAELAVSVALLLGVRRAVQRLAVRSHEHVPAGVVRGVGRVLMAAIGALAVLIALDIAHVVAIPAQALTLWTLAIPVLLSAVAGGAIAPLVPGLLIIAFHRYSVGDYVVVGPAAAPLLEGRVTRIDLYATHASTADGDATLANVVVQTAGVRRPRPKANTTA